MNKAPEHLTEEQRKSWWLARLGMHLREYWALYAATAGSLFAVAAGAPALIKRESASDIWICVFAGLAFVCIILGVIGEQRKRTTKATLEADFAEKTGALEEKLNAAQSDLEKCKAESKRFLGETQAAKEEMTRYLVRSAHRTMDQLTNLLEPALISLLRSLGVWEQSCRVSAYWHDIHGNEFVKVARVSNDPLLCTSGRGRYPDNQGLIRDAWRSGSSVDDTTKKGEKWIAHQRDRYQIPSKIAAGMKMKAGSTRGFRINSFDGTTPLGVFIIEHNKYRGLATDQVAAVLEEIDSSREMHAMQAYFEAARPDHLSKAAEPPRST